MTKLLKQRGKLRPGHNVYMHRKIPSDSCKDILPLCLKTLTEFVFSLQLTTDVVRMEPRQTLQIWAI